MNLRRSADLFCAAVTAVMAVVLLLSALGAMTVNDEPLGILARAAMGALSGVCVAASGFVWRNL